MFKRVNSNKNGVIEYSIDSVEDLDKLPRKETDNTVYAVLNKDGKRLVYLYSKAEKDYILINGDLEEINKEINNINEQLETMVNKTGGNVFIVGDDIENNGLVNVTKKLQGLLDNAKKIGSIELVFPEGIFLIDTLFIYPNTKITMTPNTVLLRDKNMITNVGGATTRMFVNQDSDKHLGTDYNSGYIEFNGGCINGNWGEDTIDFRPNYYVCACMSFAHLSRLIIKDVNFKDAANSDHIIDCSGNNNVLIENCTFEGVTANVGSSDIFYTDMIQIDHTGGFSPSIDSNLPTQNVTIKNCTFKPNFNNAKSICCLPIGGHSCLNELPYNNIVIENCDFINPLDKESYSLFTLPNVKNIKLINNRYYINTNLVTGLINLKCLNSVDSNFLIEGNKFELNFENTISNNEYVNIVNTYNMPCIEFSENEFISSFSPRISINKCKNVKVSNNKNINLSLSKIDNVKVESNVISNDCYAGDIVDEIEILNNVVDNCEKIAFNISGVEHTIVKCNSNNFKLDNTVKAINVNKIKELSFKNNKGDGATTEGTMLENSIIEFKENDNIGYMIGVKNKHSSITFTNNNNIQKCELGRADICKVFYNHLTSRIYSYVPENVLCFNNTIEGSSDGGIIMYTAGNFINISNNIILNPKGGQNIQVRNTPNSIISNNQLIKTDDTLPIPNPIVFLEGCDGAIVTNNYANCQVNNKINYINGFVMQQANANKQLIAYIGTDGTIQLKDITPS